MIAAYDIPKAKVRELYSELEDCIRESKKLGIGGGEISPSGTLWKASLIVKELLERAEAQDWKKEVQPTKKTPKKGARL